MANKKLIHKMPGFISVTVDWAGSSMELLNMAYKNGVHVKPTGRHIAGGHPEIEIIGKERDVDNFLEDYNKE